MSEYVVDGSLFVRLGAKTINHEEIVRCRDCENYSGEDNEIYPKWCMQMNITEVEPDGFCAWAERRET